MSLVSYPDYCPNCGSDELSEMGRIEAGELGPDDPPADHAIYQCHNCDYEWEQ